MDHCEGVRIIEHFVEGRSGTPEECEDFLFVNNAFVAVIDGATAKGDKSLYGSKSSGRLAGETIVDTLSTLDQAVEAFRAFEVINNRITRLYRDLNLYDHVAVHPEDRLTASIIVYSLSRNEIWSLGDCEYIVNQERFAPKKESDLATAAVRRLLIESLLVRGVKIEEIRRSDQVRELILPFLRSAQHLANVNIQANGCKLSYQYSVMDGFWTRESNVQVHPLNADASEIVLASDGYPDLRPTLQESENILRNVCEFDPLLLTVKDALKTVPIGGHAYDDRAYIRIAVPQQNGM